MLFPEIIILLLLATIFLQDLKSRSVYWIVFPALAIGLALLGMKAGGFSAMLQRFLINVGLVFVQLILVSVYFSVKHRKPAMITGSLLGWGDILFLVSIAFYLSALNFLFFYIISLCAVLLIWTVWRALSRNRNREIPLAGLQSLIFILFLSFDWWGKLFDLTNDTWLLDLIRK